MTVCCLLSDRQVQDLSKWCGGGWGGGARRPNKTPLPTSLPPHIVRVKTPDQWSSNFFQFITKQYLSARKGQCVRSPHQRDCLNIVSSTKIKWDFKNTYEPLSLYTHTHTHTNYGVWRRGTFLLADGLKHNASKTCSFGNFARPRAKSCWNVSMEVAGLINFILFLWNDLKITCMPT